MDSNQFEPHLLITQKGEIDFNYQDIKDWMEKSLMSYDYIVTEENMKTAREDRKTLNDAIKKLDRIRIDKKKEFMKPWEATEAQIKELTVMAKEKSDGLKEQLDEYEKRRINEKADQIRAYWDGKNFNLVSLDAINNPRWLNKTYSDKAWKKDIDDAIARIRNDLKTISMLNIEPNDMGNVKAYYLQTLDINAAYEHFEELKKHREAIVRAEEERRKAEEARQAELENQRLLEEKEKNYREYPEDYPDIDPETGQVMTESQQAAEPEEVIEESPEEASEENTKAPVQNEAAGGPESMPYHAIFEFFYTEKFREEMNILIQKYSGKEVFARRVE